MGDYFIKTLLIFFFMAAGVALVANADNGMFNDYYENTIRVENDNWYNVLLNSIISFESIGGAIFTGGLLYFAGASTALIVAGVMLGGIIGVVLDAMNIINVLAFPIEVQYLVFGTFTMLIITFVWRAIRGN